MRLLALFVLSLFVGACSSLTKPPAQPELALDPVLELEAKTVALAMLREDGSARAYCSGVWVSDKTILTAAHCLGLEAPYYAVKQDVLSPSGAELPVPVLRGTDVLVWEDGHDLALLRARGQNPPHKIAQVGLNGIIPGARVATMWQSYGLGGRIER